MGREAVTQVVPQGAWEGKRRHWGVGGTAEMVQWGRAEGKGENLES